MHQYSGVSTPMMSSGTSTPQRGGGYGNSQLLPNQVSGAFGAYPNEQGYSSRTPSGRYASPTSSSMMNGGGGVHYPEPPRKEFNWSTTPPQQRTPDGSPRRSNKLSNVDNNILDYALGRMEIQGNGNSQHYHHPHPRPGSNHQSPLLSRTNSHEYGRPW